MSSRPREPTYRGRMRVVSRDARRRWSLVGTGILVLCLLPAIAASRPAPVQHTDPVRLRSLILGSTARAYQGYAVSQGAAGLPNLPELTEVSGLLGGTTSIRAWYASPAAWRVATVAPTGERDVYRTADGTFMWDFEHNQLTQIVGDPPVRLPWAADVLPPELARLVLRGAGPADAVTPLGSRWIAGIAAAGLRLTPADPDTTVARVDIWADPRTGLPVQVELVGRASSVPVFSTRFLDLRQQAPDPAVLVPARSRAAGFTMTEAGDLASLINATAQVVLPERLAGRPRVALRGGITGVASYGTGLSAFLVVPVPGRVGYRLLQAARDGGTRVELTGAPSGAEAWELRTSVVTMLVVRTEVDWQSRRTYLMAGPVRPDLLHRAAGDLLEHAA